jgi:DNA-binding NtrC family response regulator
MWIEATIVTNGDFMRNQPAPQKRPTDLHINCVVLSSFDCEFAFLRNVFRLAGLRMHHAESLDQADFLLTATESTVLLSDVMFEGGSWQNALRLLRDSHPLVTMLVIADPVDGPFLRDLFDRGACGVIWRPFDFEAVRKLIRTVHEASQERRAWQEETSPRPAPLHCADYRG